MPHTPLSLFALTIPRFAPAPDIVLSIHLLMISILAHQASLS